MPDYRQCSSLRTPKPSQSVEAASPFFCWLACNWPICSTNRSASSRKQLHLSLSRFPDSSRQSDYSRQVTSFSSHCPLTASRASSWRSSYSADGKSLVTSTPQSKKVTFWGLAAQASPSSTGLSSHLPSSLNDWQRCSSLIRLGASLIIRPYSDTCTYSVCCCRGYTGISWIALSACAPYSISVLRAFLFL